MLENRVCPKALRLLLVLGLSVYYWACRGEKTTWTFGGSCDELPNPTARVIVKGAIRGILLADIHLEALLTT